MLFDSGQNVPLLRKKRQNPMIEVNEEAQKMAVAEEIGLDNKLASKHRM